MFKKFFKKVRSFVNTIWNGIKKIGTFIVDHLSPKYDPWTDAKDNRDLFPMLVACWIGVGLVTHISNMSALGILFTGIYRLWFLITIAIHAANFMHHEEARNWLYDHCDDAFGILSKPVKKFAKSNNSIITAIRNHFNPSYDLIHSKYGWAHMLVNAVMYLTPLWFIAVFVFYTQIAQILTNIGGEKYVQEVL